MFSFILAYVANTFRCRSCENGEMGNVVKMDTHVPSWSVTCHLKTSFCRFCLSSGFYFFLIFFLSSEEKSLKENICNGLQKEGHSHSFDAHVLPRWWFIFYDVENCYEFLSAFVYHKSLYRFDFPLFGDLVFFSSCCVEEFCFGVLLWEACFRHNCRIF